MSQNPSFVRVTTSCAVAAEVFATGESARTRLGVWLTARAFVDQMLTRSPYALLLVSQGSVT